MKQTLIITLITESCCDCGVIFGMNQDHCASLKDSGKTFFCPNGHSQHYTKRKTLEKIIAEKDKRIEDLSCRLDLCESKEIWLMCESRFHMALDNGGVKTIGDALRLGEEGLLSLHGVGPKCIEQINDSLLRYNVRLK